MAYGDVWKVALKAQLSGQLYVLTPHVIEGVYIGDFAQDMAEWAETWLDTNMKSKVASNCKWDTIELRNLTTTTEGLDYPVSITGNRASEPLPNNVAMVVSLRTGLVGRRYRGRLYVAGLTEDVNDSGTWNASFAAGIGTIWEDWLNISFSLGIPHAAMCVYSRKYGIATPVTAISVSQYPGTQRRRRIGVGA